MKPIELFGIGVAGKSLAITAQRRLNCYYEIRPDGDKTKIAIFGTPGLLLFKSFGANSLRGGWAVGNLAYVVQYNSLYSVDNSGAQTLLGTLNTFGGPVSIVDNGFQLMIVDGTNGYTFTISGSTFSQISSGNFPNGATTVAFQDGYFLVENPLVSGQWFKSGSYDGQSWGALDYGTMVSTPTPCVAVDSDHGYVITWGSNAIEFNQDTGSQGFPFSPVRSAALQYGLAAKWSRAKCNDGICFLAQPNNQGQVIVMKLTGFTLTKISTSDIDNIINNLTTKSNATGLSYMVDGHPMYEITFPTDNRSFLYDDSTQMWSEVQTGTDLIGRHIAQYSFSWLGQTYITDYLNGNLYTISPNTYTDNGATIKRLIQTRHQVDGLNEVSLDEIMLEMETGVGLQSGQGSAPQMVLQVSKDKGRTFGIERPVSIGLVGQYQLTGAHWTRMGSSNDFVLRFWMTDPVKFAISQGYGMTEMGPQ